MNGGQASVDGLMISSAVDQGVVLSAGNLQLIAADISGTTSDGITVLGGSLVGSSGLSVTGSGGSGLFASAGTVDLTGGIFSDNDTAGIHLSGSVVADITSPTVETNDNEGLLCDGGVATPSSSSVSLQSCDLAAANNGTAPYSLINGCELDWTCSLD
jgi:hypothetical protein